MRYRKVPVYIFKILVAVAFTFLCAGVVEATGEKWQLLIWNDDLDEMAEFCALCTERGLTSFDVLEANGCSAGTLPCSGEELLMPKSKSDLLSTWMEVQSRTGGPKPLVTIKLHGVPVSLRESAPAAPAVPKQEPALPDVQPESEPDVLPQQELDISPKAGQAGRGCSAADIEAMFAQIQETPLVTIKPHVVPGITRDQLVEAQQTPSVQATATIVSSKPPAPVVSEPSPEPAVPGSVEENSAELMKNMKIVISGDDILLLTSDNSLKDSAVLSPVPDVTPSVVPGRMIWPVRGKVSSGYGRRGKKSFHSGVDLPMPPGSAIVAALDGAVLETATSKDKRYRGYGNTVLIDHGKGLVTLYAHCSSINVTKGQRVKQGDIVAFIGRTGRATTDHVHFEVRVNGKAVDPISYLPPR